MVERRQGLMLFVLAAADADFDRGMARIGADRNIRDIHIRQPGIGHLKSDNLGKLVADGGGNAFGTMVIHTGWGWWVVAYTSRNG